MSGKKVYKKPIMKRKSHKKLIKSIKIKPYNHQEKYEFIYLLGNLLENGFSLEQSIQFMKTISFKQGKQLNYIERKLLKGESLAKCLLGVGFSKEQLAPIKFSEVHGDLVGTLKRMSSQMKERQKQRKEMIKVLSYPILLLIFLIGIIIGMKWVILPQLSELSQDPATPSMFSLIDKGLKYGLFFISTLILSGYLVVNQLNRYSQIKKLMLYARLPVIGKLLTSYYTSLFATEWGNLLSQGMEFKEVVLVMQQKGYSQLMQEMSKEIKIKLEQGIFIDEPISQWRFLKPELTWLIRQGEIHGRLGQELTIFGEREWENFMTECEKKIQLLQPITFLIIAILIVSVYGSLLLPIYNGMGDFY
ncbi:MULTISPECIES: competence type IV pilus assembly protein ComGB [Enterococcaceae]|uniref:competence type IV pilus assembly protein ComGB n=1 Tax=Enterococcaceae TaxID=81852 RepID=UPI001314B25E|nr:MULTISPECIES: competence type IV pilus assembly protein ComGB [Enterococcaceae]UNM89270.1 type II secretion system F family protein [Vagococcus sp. CY52-2]